MRCPYYAARCAELLRGSTVQPSTTIGFPHGGHRTEIKVAEAELAALAEDDKADLSALETKVKQSEALRSGLRMAVIKAKRDALAVLTPEQREKLKAEHEKMMHDMQRSHGSAGGDMREGKGAMDRSHGGSSPAAPSKEKKEEPKQ